MQRDDASVSVTEYTLDRAPRPEAGKAIRVLKTETAAAPAHTESMTGFCATSGPRTPLLSKGESTFMSPISPTRLREEPVL